MQCVGDHSQTFHCDTSVVGGIWVPRLALLVDSQNICPEPARPSLSTLVAVHVLLLSTDNIPLGTFWEKIQICIALVNYHTNARGIVLFDCIRVYL